MEQERTIQIQLNGEPYQMSAKAKVSDLVAKLDLVPERLAIEYNLVILPRAKWSGTALCEGDKVEIVHFVGGG